METCSEHVSVQEHGLVVNHNAHVSILYSVCLKDAQCEYLHMHVLVIGLTKLCQIHIVQVNEKSLN